jgi:hypothetical protein
MKSDDVVDSIPSSVNSFSILTEVLHITMTTTLPSLAFWNCADVYTNAVSCLDRSADSWYVRTNVLCVHYFTGGFIGILIVCLMKEFGNAFNICTEWKGSNTITMQLQLAVLSQSACCTIFIPQLQAHDSKLQYSYNLVGFTTNWFKNSANSYRASVQMCKAAVYSLWRQDSKTFCATHEEDSHFCLICVYYIQTYAQINSVN